MKILKSKTWQFAAAGSFMYVRDKIEKLIDSKIL